MDDKPRIIIIDDEASVRHSLAAFFEDWDFNVSCAEDAEEGLIILDTQVFDLAIVDMRLPGKDGNTFIREAVIKQPALRFLIHTGSKQYVLPYDLIELGIQESHIFLKPVKDMNLFITKIEELGVSG
ncbi:response regulator [bacterium]|nr:response regulator [bacterium]